MFPVPNISNKLNLKDYDKLRLYMRGKKSYTEETIERYSY